MGLTPPQVAPASLPGSIQLCDQGMGAEMLRCDLGANLQLHFHSHKFLALSLILGGSSPVGSKRIFTDCQHWLWLARGRCSSPRCLGEVEERERKLWVFSNYLINFISVLRLFYWFKYFYGFISNIFTTQGWRLHFHIRWRQIFRIYANMNQSCLNIFYSISMFLHSFFFFIVM